MYQQLIPVFVSLFFLLAIILFIVNILIMIWVYRDAESRGMNGVLWLIVALVAGIIGLIIYLIVREPKRPSSTQMFPSPIRSGLPTRQFCKYCGSRLPSDARFCPNCGEAQD